MFLFPALAAVVCDSVVIYLRLFESYGIFKQSNDDSSPDIIVMGGFLNCALYMVFFSISRLFLLIPLIYYGFSGRRMKFAQFHHIFHGVAAFILVMHALGILEAESVLMQQHPDGNSSRKLLLLLFSAESPTLLPFRTIGVMICLSMCSIACHWTVLRHVRTTAPRNSMAPGSQEMERKKKQRLAYAYRKLHLKESSGRRSHFGVDPRETEPMLLCSTNTSAKHQDFDPTVLERESSFDDFFHELNSRFDLARQRWTVKLDEVTSQLSGGGGGGAGQHNHQHQNNTNHNPRWNLLHFDNWGPTSPFRLLLQLFAYEDENNIIAKLDALFEKDKGETLGFYVPQLLSFLLHGAYLNADALEAFLLDKCSRSLHFGHKCYWFLRAWCLCLNGEQQKAHNQQQHQNYYQNNPQADDNDHSPSSPLVIGSYLTSASATDLSSHRPPTFPSHGSSPNLKRLSSSSTSSKLALIHADAEKIDGGKLTPEERFTIEDFMARIVDCSEEVSSLLQAGGAGSTCPSPLVSDDDEEDEEENVDGHRDVAALHDDNISTSIICSDVEAGLRNIHSSFNHRDHLFLATPRFLDCLLAIADDLMLVAPREQRTVNLRQKLKHLEKELLPSNVVYVPLGCAKHRVWRIVADESIALSTKERVPCIVTLEVIDYSLSNSRKQKGRWALARTDRELLQEWMQRPPQRHNTILEVISNYTNQGIKIIKDEFEEVKRISAVKGFLQHNNIHNHGTIPIAQNLTDHNDDDALFHDALEFHHDELSETSGVTYDRPSSPFECMGQWSSPPKEKRLMKRFDASHEQLKVAPVAPRAKRIIERSSSSPSSLDEDYGSTHDVAKVSPLIIHDKLTPKAIPDTSPFPSAASCSKHESTSVRSTPLVVFKEDWSAKQERIKRQSCLGNRVGWRLLPVLVKSNDDLRQEQLASQLIQRMAIILARANIPVWLCPYEILALTGRGGIIEAIPDTISLDSLKRNDPSFTDLQDFFTRHFGPVGSNPYADAKANFVESLAGYSIVCFILQIKDRHNGNILLDNRGHLIHIDFGFFFLSSPGKNAGFESAPFKLTRDFVKLMEGVDSRTFARFRDLCIRAFLEIRKHCLEIILLVEMIIEGNDDLPCFRGQPEKAVSGMRERFRLDLNDRACIDYVNALIDESIENWRTRWYDRYQRYCVGVL